MSEITSLPISAVLGDRNGLVTVEESLSKDLPNDVGANAPVQEFNRQDAIFSAVKRQSGRRSMTVSVPSPAQTPNMAVIRPSQYHFFVIKGKKLEFIGTKEMPAEKFAKDISGRFFREWLRQSFPGRRDYDDICVWDDNTKLKEITDLLGITDMIKSAEGRE